MDLKLISDDGDVLRVEMLGPIVESVMTPDLKPFEDLLGPQGYTRTVLVSMAEITLIDSRGLSWLLINHKRFRQTGGRLVVHSVHPQVMEILAVARFERVLHLAEDEPAALELLRHPEA